MSSELKNIIGSIVKSLSSLFAIDVGKDIVARSLMKFYDKGLQDMEVKFNMNFTRKDNRVELLNDYVAENIKGMNEEMQEKIRKEVTQGVMNNESVAAIAERIQGVSEMAQTRAKMIARTESNRAEGMAHRDAARQTGLQLVKYVDAHLDKRTSSICQGLDQKYGSADKAIPTDAKFELDGQEWDINPFHVNCRSRVVYVEGGS